MQPILRKQLSGPLSVSRFRVEIRQREPIAIGPDELSRNQRGDDDAE
jgi:hypothetical protein